MQIGLALPHLLLLLNDRLKQVADRGVVGKHHSGDLVRGFDVGRLFRERHLDRGRTPRDEVGQLTLTDALERFVHLSRVHLTLDDVQDRDVPPILQTGRHQNVLDLQQSAHYI